MDPELFLFAAYAATMSLLGVYGLHRVLMLARFDWQRSPRRLERETSSNDPLPHVTVQLPVFNERTVAERLIAAAGALDYPSDRLEIQVLDDSTDQTTELVDSAAARLRESGVPCEVIRREDRVGFKAGALDHGMQHARGDLLCIFDADFVPGPDFLKQLVPFFADPEIGMVQARWGHRNRDESWLTRAQSTLLDGHFVIEHKVRNDQGLFFNFNGTAGVWRRQTIIDAGGWQHDTLTEDLDLSYRAQLRGWKFHYEPHVVAPAEIPPDIAAFKSQQHRWAKGSVQVMRKLAGTILRSREPLRVKLEAFAHLTGNVGYPCVLLLALLLPLSLTMHEHVARWTHVILFVLCSVSVIAFYERSQRAIDRPLRKRARDIIAAISLGIGMCVSQTKAVFEGLRSNPGAFVRTPKRGDEKGTSAYRVSLRGLPGVELLLSAWFAWGLYRAIRLELWGSIPFLLLFFVSFTWVGTLSIREATTR